MRLLQKSYLILGIKRKRSRTRYKYQVPWYVFRLFDGSVDLVLTFRVFRIGIEPTW